MQLKNKLSLVCLVVFAVLGMIEVRKNNYIFNFKVDLNDFISSRARKVRKGVREVEKVEKEVDGRCP